MSERDQAKRIAAEKSDQYTYGERADGSWVLVTDDCYVAAHGDAEPTPSTFWCSHPCCICPNDPDHMHLFESCECIDCQAIEKLRITREELQP